MTILPKADEMIIDKFVTIGYNLVSLVLRTNERHCLPGQGVSHASGGEIPAKDFYSEYKMGLCFRGTR